MTRLTSAVLPGNPVYDDCLISSCLKKLFSIPAKSKAGPEIVITTNIAELKNELESLNKEGIPDLSYPYLEAMERSLPGSGFRYVVIYKHHQPVLFTYFQLVTITSKNFSFEKNKSCVRGIFSFFLDLKKVRVLFSGNALRYETACYCYDKVVLSNREAVEIVASVADKIAGEEKSTAIVLKDIPVTTGIRKWLAGLGYTMPWNDQVMELYIDKQWGDITGYVSRLSRKYKTRANKILASGNLLSIRELSASEIAQYESVMYGLYQSVVDRQQFVLIQPQPDHFIQMKKAYGHAFEVFGFFAGDTLVAFYSAIVSDYNYELYYVGFDPEANGRYQLYFNLLFSGLERAIALKKKRLKLGRTSFDAKASLGAAPLGTNYQVKIANVPNVVIDWFANYFSTLEDAKWKLRNPLKEA